MLIGSVKKLNELESYIENAIIKNNQQRNTTQRHLNDLQKIVNTISRVSVNDQGHQQVNEEYIQKWEEFQEQQNYFASLHEKAKWLEEKRRELESFEEAARRKGVIIRKDEFSVELTLNDLQYLDIPREEVVPGGPEKK